jgi:hypothetical protein
MHPSTHNGVLFTAVTKGPGINQTAVNPMWEPLSYSPDKAEFNRNTPLTTTETPKVDLGKRPTLCPLFQREHFLTQGHEIVRREDHHIEPPGPTCTTGLSGWS